MWIVIFAFSRNNCPYINRERDMMTGTDQHDQLHLSKHRIEALVDGIFAVAMTLLVIDLRLSEHAHFTSDAELRHALLDLVPNLVSWIVSFFVLAIFWIANHRLYSYVRHVDHGLLWLTVFNLAGVALLPFASALTSQFPSLTGQIIYSGVMILIASSTLLLVRHIHRHPELCGHPMSQSVYRATIVRSYGVITIATLAAVVSYYQPHFSSAIFVLMATLRPLSGYVERIGKGPDSLPIQA
jgi:uncharacterized membrane protein